MSGSRDLAGGSGKPASDAAALFQQAVEAVERLKPEHRQAKLPESARAVVDAFLAARGRRARDDAERLQLISALPLLDAGSDQVLHRLLAADPSNVPGDAELHRLELRYRALLPALRAALARELPGYRGAAGVFQDILNSRPVRFLLALLAALVLVSGTLYAVTEPAYRLELGGQLFWKSVEGEPFSEERSRDFAVIVDGTARRYVIELASPVVMHTVRLDPVDSAAPTSIEVRRIRLVTPDGGAKDIPPGNWSCTNCRWIDTSADHPILKPTGSDPRILVHPDKPTTTRRVEVDMTATARKSFWEWLTRLDRPARY